MTMLTAIKGAVSYHITANSLGDLSIFRDYRIRNVNLNYCIFINK